jgi:hypothetical protein
LRRAGQSQRVTRRRPAVLDHGTSKLPSLCALSRSGSGQGDAMVSLLLVRGPPRIPSPFVSKLDDTPCQVKGCVQTEIYSLVYHFSSGWDVWAKACKRTHAIKLVFSSSLPTSIMNSSCSKLALKGIRELRSRSSRRHDLLYDQGLDDSASIMNPASALQDSRKLANVESYQD